MSSPTAWPAPGPAPTPLHHRPELLAMVFCGGAAGTAVRAGLDGAFPAGPGGWPWATFGINVSGSFLLGALLAVLIAGGPDTGRRRAARLALGTGVLGGYTTYSTFVVEIVRLAEGAHLGTAAAYAASSLALGVAGAAAGFAVVRRLRAFAGVRRLRAGGGR